MNIFYLCGLIIFTIIASLFAIVTIHMMPQHQQEIISWEYVSPNSDSTTQSYNPVDNRTTLQQELRSLVESKGYTWEQWLRNDIPRDVKWGITSEHSKYILKYIQ
jgi:hypothetical protein